MAPVDRHPIVSAEESAALEAALGIDYRLERLLGTGTTSRVYLARDRALDMPVTIKVLNPEAAASPEARARFEREARAAANITHPNVANVHRFGVLARGEPFLVSEYVPGRTLDDHIAATGPMPPDEVRRILADVASALDAAHRHGVIHRDIRPANILIDEDEERAIVTDFGIAAVTEAWTHGTEDRLTRTGQLLGDPRYVSPEQFRGEHVTDTSDVYSLALVAYEMLTGNRPHADLGARRAAAARLTGEPVEFPIEIDDADPALADLLRRCLAADPGRRPGARTLARRLRGADHRTEGPPLPDFMRRAWAAVSRRRLPQWVAAAGAGGWGTLQVVDQAIQNDLLPSGSYRAALITVLAAIPAAAVLAWFHGARGEQRIRPLELVLLASIAAGWILALLLFVAA